MAQKFLDARKLTSGQPVAGTPEISQVALNERRVSVYSAALLPPANPWNGEQWQDLTTGIIYTWLGAQAIWVEQNHQ